MLEPLELMAHTHVRHPTGDLRSSKSAILPICHRPSRRPGPSPKTQPHALPWGVRPELQASRVGRAKTQPGAENPKHRSLPCPGCSACSGSSPSISRPAQMRRQAQGDRLHRGSRRHRHHPRAHSTTRGGRTVTTARATPALGAPRHPKPGQAVLEHRLTLVCGLDVGDAPIPCGFPRFSVTRNFRAHSPRPHPASALSHPYRPYSADHTIRAVILPMLGTGSEGIRSIPLFYASIVRRS